MSDLGELKSTEEAVSRSLSLACWDIWRFWIAVCNSDEWALDILSVFLSWIDIDCMSEDVQPSI